MPAPNNFLFQQAEQHIRYLKGLMTEMEAELEVLRPENDKLKEELKHANEAKHSLSAKLKKLTKA